MKNQQPKLKLLSIALTGTLTACALQKNLPPPIPYPTILKAQSILSDKPILSDEEIKSVFTETPSNLEISFTELSPEQTNDLPLILDTEDSDIVPIKKQTPISVNFENLPLPAFINEVFGNLLGLNFQITPELQDRKDLVTLRITEPQSPKALYQLAIQVLNTYGIDVVRHTNQLMQFVLSNNAQANTLPLISLGNTLPNVPASNRPIFQIVPLKVLSGVDVRNFLSQIYQNSQLKITQDLVNNTLLLSGPPSLIQHALNMIDLLDRPLMRGQHVMRIDPIVMNAQELAEALVSSLKNKGYSISLRVAETGNNILLLPVNKINSLFVFTSSKDNLAEVKRWAIELDRSNPQIVSAQAESQTELFSYRPKNIAAISLVGILQPLLDNSNVVTATKSHLVVDEARNILFYQGSTERWLKIQPLLQQMDQPSKMVLIEAIIAEVVLSEQEQFGVEWLIQGLNQGHLTGVLSTIGGLSVGGSGLTYTLLSAEQLRAVLNVFASNSRLNVLSSPRLMVKSGVQASINVGSEVPILTSQSTSAEAGQVDGNSAILQQIQYRSTGISLQVKPTVYADRRVELEITQSVSDADVNTTSNISSPTIRNRSIQTELTLMDGHSVLLGGLVQESKNIGASKVPILGDLPIVGNLFRSGQNTSDKTELIVMIVPYVISDDFEALAITQAFQDQLTLLPNSALSGKITPSSILDTSSASK